MAKGREEGSGGRRKGLSASHRVTFTDRTSKLFKRGGHEAANQMSRKRRLGSGRREIKKFNRKRG